MSWVPRCESGIAIVKKKEGGGNRIMTSWGWEEIMVL